MAVKEVARLLHVLWFGQEERKAGFKICHMTANARKVAQVNLEGIEMSRGP